MMELQERQEGRVFVVSLAGLIRADSDLKDLERFFTTRGSLMMVVELSRLEYINSQGLSILLSAWRRARREGGRVIMAAARGAVRKIFEVTHLGSFITTCDSLDEAMAVLTGSAPQQVAVSTAAGSVNGKQ